MHIEDHVELEIFYTGFGKSFVFTSISSPRSLKSFKLPKLPRIIRGSSPREGQHLRKISTSSNLFLWKNINAHQNGTLFGLRAF